MQGHKTKLRTGSLILIVSVVLILAVVNVYSYRHFQRLDLTSSKEYTLSQSSKDVVSRLKDVVTIRAYFSKKLPPYLAGIERDVRDTLSEYRAYSKGNLQVEFIDPSDNPQLQQELRFKGIMQVPLSILQKDRAEAINVYLAMMIQYENRTQTIPVILDVGNLEYDLTGAILKVTETEKSVGLLTNNEDVDLDRDYQRFRRELEKQYVVRVVPVEPGRGIPRNVHTLMIISPKDFTDRELYEIDQFLMNGGKIVFLIDAVEMSKETLSATARLPNIAQLIEHYGVKIDPDLVVDLSPSAAALATFNTGYISMTVPYPFWVKAIKRDLSKESPIVSGLESVVFPWVSSQEIVQDNTKGLTVAELVHTTPYAKTVIEPFNLNPQQNFRAGAKKEDLKSYLLASAISGKFTSFYKGKEIPKEEKPEDEKNPRPPTPEKEMVSESPETQILVVANSRLIQDRSVWQFPGNLVFMMNGVDWLTLGNELISIRTRRVIERPIIELSDAKKATVRFLNIFAVSVLVVLLGIVRIFLKRRKRRYYESILVRG
jgi:ABC-2 type transport system permease protein